MQEDIRCWGGRQHLLPVEQPDDYPEHGPSFPENDDRFKYRLDRLDRLERRLAATKMMVGTLLVLAAGATAAYVSLRQFYVGENIRCFDEQGCPSGNNYMPETVSEMVSPTMTHDPDSPQAKIFASLTIVGALLLVFSRYPWHMRNVYSGYSGPCCLATIRTLLPPIGMLVVCFVPVTVPKVGREWDQKIACSLHNLGAAALVLGSLACEAHCLCQLRWLSSCERCMRWTMVALAGLCLFVFLVAGLLFGVVNELGLCCSDTWVPTKSALAAVGFHSSSVKERVEVKMAEKVLGNYVLTDTASGYGLLVKQVEFFSECGFLTCVFLNHLIIYCFSHDALTRVTVPPRDGVQVI